MNTTAPHRWRYCRQAAALAAPPDLPPLRSILTGDALAWLRRLPDASIDCVITSPPYHLLRNYDAGKRELGTETDVNAYVDRLADICDEIGRILTPTGGLWLNLGDSFSRGPRYGALAKSLLLVPDRVLLTLLDRGWRVRNKVVWAKTNPTPNSVRDRFSTTWEPMYFLVRSRQYHFDLDAVREPHRTVRQPRPIKLNPKYGGDRPPWAGPLAGRNDGLERTRAEGRPGHPLGKNPGDVWHLATAGYRGAHFAVWPARLVQRPLIAGCPERVCTDCGQPWTREQRRDRLGAVQPTCNCAADWRLGRVLDPFMGSGTVALVAEQHGRDWLGIELNPTYVEMAQARINRARKNTRNERSTP
jgi:DNA modification methylase